jgi:tetratricopeptide (TPR) repeat protein
MRATVLRDPRLLKLAGRFVWLSIDAERERNAPFLEGFQVEGYPTFLILDAETGKAVLRWPGSAGVREMLRLLDDALVALRAAGGAGPEAALSRGDRLNAEGRIDEAAEAWSEALRLGGVRWERRGRAVESLVLALQGAGKARRCAETAGELAPGLPRGSSFANAALAGLSCALGAPAEERWRAAAISRLEPLSRRAARLPDLLADDRAFALQTLAEARQAAKDGQGARGLWRRLWAFLEAEGKRAPNAEVRASLDSFRTSCAISLGDPARALAALRASEAALPRDYNPPYRLGILHREMGRNAEALGDADRALERAYGPRKLRVYDLRAGIQKALGDAAGRRATLQAALAHAATLPEAQRRRATELVERMRRQLAE